MKAFERGVYSMALFVAILLVFAVVIFVVPFFLYVLLNCTHLIIPHITQLSYTTVMGVWCAITFTYIVITRSRKED
jgi:hypothetical protein